MQSKTDQETNWKPFDIFTDQAEENKFAFILLNQPITDINEAYFLKLWSKSVIKLCADGAANRLYEWNVSRGHLRNINLIPDYICGDLDSIKPEIKEYYQKCGTKVVSLACQDFTDFHKTLQFAITCSQNEDSQSSETPTRRYNFSTIYCFCNFSGRLDHALANLHSLYSSSLSSFCTYIVSDESLTFLLRRGENRIFVESEFCGKYCGFFPVGSATKVTTQGLKWNLSDDLCSFDGLVSSSNEFDLSSGVKHVSIITERPILWTMSINIGVKSEKE